MKELNFGRIKRESASKATNVSEIIEIKNLKVKVKNYETKLSIIEIEKKKLLIDLQSLDVQYKRQNAKLQLIFKKTLWYVKAIYKSSHSDVFLREDVLKICRKCTGEHPCQSAISMKLLCNFTEIALRHEYSHVNLMHVFRAPFPKNTSGRLLLCSSVTIEDQYRSNSKVSTLFFIRLY